jgi:hypothetical protein
MKGCLHHPDAPPAGDNRTDGRTQRHIAGKGATSARDSRADSKGTTTYCSLGCYMHTYAAGMPPALQVMDKMPDLMHSMILLDFRARDMPCLLLH